MYRSVALPVVPRVSAVLIGIFCLFLALPAAPAEAQTNNCPTLSRTLGLNSVGDDVAELQRFLAKDRTIYPEASVTGFFGPLTEAAVQRFQSRYQIVTGGDPATTGFGVVGRLTRAKIAELCAGSTTPPPPPPPRELPRIVTFNASPNPVPSGSISTMTWVSQNAQTCALFQNNPNGTPTQIAANLPVSGTYGVTQTAASSYIVRCQNATGEYDLRSIQISTTAPTPPEQTAAFDSGTLQSSSRIPLITGTAQNVTSLNMTVASPLGQLVTAPNIPVNNGKWSLQFTSPLAQGVYSLALFTQSGLLLNTNTLTILGGTPTTPTSVATLRASQTAGIVPLSVNFTFTVPDQNGTYALDFGDTQTLNNVTAACAAGAQCTTAFHTYTATGTYEAKLQSVAAGVRTVLATTTITVTATGSTGQVVYCPTILRTLEQGATDATTNGQVSELQRFLADFYRLDRQELVTGFFGSVTRQHVVRFQQDAGITPTGVVGALTREAIEQNCGIAKPKFTATPVSGAAPLTVSFAYSTTAEPYIIYFGDGTSSTTMTQVTNEGGARSIASHTYTASGTYTARVFGQTAPISAVCTLTADADGNVVDSCTDGIISPLSTVKVTVSPPVSTAAALTATPSTGRPPLRVQYGISGPPGSYTLRAGDTATVQFSTTTAMNNVKAFDHTYTGNGKFIAELINNSSNAVVASTTVQVGDMPFVSPTSGPAPLTVTASFTRATPCSPYRIVWGDGLQDARAGVSAAPCAQVLDYVQKTHTYTTQGTFSVSLTNGECVAVRGGCTEEPIATSTVTVTGANGLTIVANPQRGAPPLAVTFSVTGSYGGNYILNYGDTKSDEVSMPVVDCVPSAAPCNTSRSQTTTHTYATAGTFVASLRLFGTQTEVASTTVRVGAPAACIVLTRNMGPDDNDADSAGEVSKLQAFLAQDEAVYPEGLVTGYFGPATMRAVQRWQTKKGIVTQGTPDTTGYGFVGKRTRAALGEGCGGTPSGPVSIGSVTGPTALAAGQTGTWTINATTNTNDPVTFSVQWGDEGQGSFLEEYTSALYETTNVTGTFTHAYAAAGIYQPKFTVKKGNTTAHKTVTVTVGGGGETPGQTGLASITSASKLVAHAYRCALGREGSASEIASFGSQVPSVLTLYRNIYTSAEYAATNADNTAYIQSLYRCVLFREGEPTGVQTHLSAMSAGASRDVLLQAFITSPEFQSRVAPVLNAFVSNTSSGLRVLPSTSGLSPFPVTFLYPFTPGDNGPYYINFGFGSEFGEGTAQMQISSDGKNWVANKTYTAQIGGQGGQTGKTTYYVSIGKGSPCPDGYGAPSSQLTLGATVLTGQSPSCSQAVGTATITAVNGERLICSGTSCQFVPNYEAKGL